VAWILDSSSGDYHTRTWESQKDQIKNDTFIASLVLNGEYDSQLLQESSIKEDTQTLAAVVTQ
jgi:hypothetical protein